MKIDIPKKWMADKIEEEELLILNNLQMIGVKKIIILAAISLSGKTTYADKLRSEGDYYIVHPDNLRFRITGNESDMSKDGYIWNQLVPLEIAKGILSKKDVLIDATNLTQVRRKFFIDIVRGRDKDIPIECHYIEPNLQLSLERNKIRERKLPESVIIKQFNSWQEPKIEEGFSKVIKIN